ncbi:hypothetical protein [Sorangium sp. So ce388]|uniref:hypothetical protein n=1 Tax=Sorangium sp. So ce388 TaxID=3133309 RepID=UPI003F5AEBCC
MSGFKSIAKMFSGGAFGARAMGSRAFAGLPLSPAVGGWGVVPAAGAGPSVAFFSSLALRVFAPLAALIPRYLMVFS